MCPSLRRAWLAIGVLSVAGTALSAPNNAQAGSARDYLNAPIDSWFAFYNVGYAASVTPEDGLDVSARIRTNVVSQSLVLTRTMDYWGRTGGISIVLPYLYVESSSGSNSTAVSGVSDVGFLWQMNIFGGPALTREEFASFVPQTFASFHLYRGNTAGGLSIKPRAQPVGKPMDRPSHSQLQLHAGPRLDMARNLRVSCRLHSEQRVPGWRCKPPDAESAAHRRRPCEPQHHASHLAVSGHLLQCRRRDEYRRGASGQRSPHAATGRRHGRAALAWRRHGPECRVRRRQASE